MHTHFTSCHPSLQMLKKDLSKEKPWESYEKTPQKQTLRKIIQIFKKTLDGRRLPTIFDRKPTIRNKIHKKESKLLKQNNKEEKEILPFVTQYQPSVSTIKEAWMKKWNLIQNQLLNFNKFLKSHQSFPYKKGKSLKDMLVRTKKKKVNRGFHARYRCAACHPFVFSRTTGLWVF